MLNKFSFLALAATLTTNNLISCKNGQLCDDWNCRKNTLTQMQKQNHIVIDPQTGRHIVLPAEQIQKAFDHLVTLATLNPAFNQFVAQHKDRLPTIKDPNGTQQTNLPKSTKSQRSQPTLEQQVIDLTNWDSE